MPAEGLRMRLEQLLELILKERECAKSLALDEFMETVRAKQEVLLALEPQDMAGAELRDLAEKIRMENRRNAYLLWSSLKWVQETMGSFGRQVTPSGYGAAGLTSHSTNSGRLLSGRV